MLEIPGFMSKGKIKNPFFPHLPSNIPYVDLVPQLVNKKKQEERSVSTAPINTHIPARSPTNSCPTP